MILNHINLTVNDVPAAADFLVKYFELTSHGGNKGMMALTDDNGLVLTLMKSKADGEYPGSFHIGFGQPDRAAVDEIHQRLKADGFKADPPMEAHGYVFYVDAPGGFSIEVGA